MAQITLGLPEDLLRELESRAEKSGKSIPDFIREELELRYLHRLPEHKRGDISDRPEVQMFQIAELGGIAVAEHRNERCVTEYVQVSSQVINAFEAYSVLGASQRYLVVSGEGSFEHLSFASPELRCVPKLPIQGFLDALE